MSKQKTPGVYVEEISKLPPSVVSVETANPAFIGYTEKSVDSKGEDLRDIPTRISSLVDYERFFGGPATETGIVVDIVEDPASSTFAVNGRVAKADRSKFIMYYAMQMYFNNGGGACWIVSVGDYESTGGLILPADLTQGLATTERVDEITLYVFPDAQGLDNADDFYNTYTAAIDLCVELQDRFTIMDVWHDPAVAPDQWLTNINTLRNKTPVEIRRLMYAAAYYPNLNTTLDLFYGTEEDGGDDNVTIAHIGGDGSLSGTLTELREKNNALYFQAKSAINAIATEMPPSSAMAGIYARVDNTRGVWKAPANVSLNSVSGPVQLITDREQEGLNVDANTGKSINVIRAFTGRGIMVWGARTLAGNDNEWRYISVRRFFNMVEESVKKATVQFLFEPNDINTWVRVRGMIENYLILQWRAGALQGATTEQAFFARVGLGETMTALDISEGRMIVEIGMAVVRPAEFIILNFTHKMAEG